MGVVSAARTCTACSPLLMYEDSAVGLGICLSHAVVEFPGAVSTPPVSYLLSI